MRDAFSKCKNIKTNNTRNCKLFLVVIKMYFSTILLNITSDMQLKFSIISLVFLVSSCNYIHCPSKDAFLDSYETFVLKVEQKRLDKAKDWSADEKIFEDYADRCYEEYKYEFTIEDKSRFWTSTLKYYYNRYNGNLDEAFKNVTEKLSNDFEKDFNQILMNGDKEIMNMAKELFRDDIIKGVDDVLEVIIDVGEKIKESLEEEK